MTSFSSKPLTALDTYMYGLKSRAHLHHCLGHAMLPVDVTDLCALRKRFSREVEPVTLTALILKAVALAIRANPCATRILFQRFPLRRRMVSFDAVDVNVPITRDVDGERVTFIGIIRAADELTITEIQQELTHLQRDPPEESPYISKLEKLKSAPPIAVSLYHWLMARSPRFYLKNAGTCGVVSMDAMLGAHFFPIGPTTAMFGIGGIGDQVVARNGVPVVRRMLQVSLALDNYVVSGPEGVDLCVTLQRLLESGSFVKDEMGTQESDLVTEFV